MSKDRDDKGLVPSAVIGRGEIVATPALNPMHSMQSARAVAAGLTGQAEQAVALQAGAGDIEMAMATMAKLKEFTEFLKKLAFSDLRAGDFVRFSSISGDEDDAGKPWLTVGAAERVAETCGIAYGFLEPALETEHGEDSDGPYFIRRARMFFRVGSRYVEAIGEIDSRDELLSHRGTLTAAQVPKTKIGQKAVSRATQIGIGKILGLRALTFERLAELMGENAPNPETIQSAKFKRGSKGGGLSTGQGSDRATSAQVGGIYDSWCKATGRSNKRGDDATWKANSGPFWAFMAEALGLDPQSRSKKWKDYTKGELRKAEEHINTIKTRGGSDA